MRVCVNRAIYPLTRTSGYLLPSRRSIRRRCTEHWMMSTTEMHKMNSYHDIFLSHSGKQKGFVKGLYKMLTLSNYTTFFDIADHSLPPAQVFPTRIFEAAKNCRLAVVVLSNDFVISKWPMLELCAFVKAAASVQILPLFYELSPSDLKLQSNLDKWRKEWEFYAEQDPKRIDVLEWKKALGKICSLNGLIFDPSEGELAYLEKIVSSISKVIAPAIQYDEEGIHGKERLCQVILNTFAELESSITPQPSCTLDTPLNSSVCILGVFGLQGSGKSTLSKCLCNHYSRDLHGKALYLNLPQNPTDDKLVDVCKGLFTRLSNFHSMVNLTDASTLEQMYYILSSIDLQHSNVFLVVDNILEETREFVQRILSFVVEACSKVLLVARASHLLYSLLHFQQCNSPHIVCNVISVPTINEKEALQILLQSQDAHVSSARHQQRLEEVVRLSGFVYLPMVLKLMGARLRLYGLDVDKWGSDMESLCTKVKKCKERAIIEFVQDSFMKLTEQLQLLFLDLSLFVIPSSYAAPTKDRSESCELLSVMHKCSLADIEMHLCDLQKHCFLENVKCDDTSVHDVFLEFAASIPQSSRYYLSLRKGGRSNKADILLPRLELPPPAPNGQEKAIFGLRAVVLELNEGYERFNFWPGFSSVESLVLRNCKTLAVLNLVGLTSLSSLDIHNCPCLKSAELPASGSDLAHSIRRLKWVNGQGENMQLVPQYQEGSNMQRYVEKGKQLLRSAWSWTPGLSRVPARNMVDVGGFAFQMKGLQVLNLENTGVTHLGDMSGCWPLLEQLKIIEGSLEHIEVGYLPNLKSFIFSGDGSDEYLIYIVEERAVAFDFQGYNPRWLKGKNLLAGCPKLEEVWVRSASFEDGLGTLHTSKLRKFWLGNFWRGPKLPDLSMSAQSLQQLLIVECRELKSVEFMYWFQSLTELRLIDCPSLAEVSGLDRLPNLSDLEISGCTNLQNLSGLNGLLSLEDLTIWDCHSLAEVSGLDRLSYLSELAIGGCRNLQTLSGLSGLVSLESLIIQHCPKLQTLSGLSGLVSLESLAIEYCLKLQTLGGLSGLVNLEQFEVGNGCPNLQVLESDIENLTELKRISYWYNYQNAFISHSSVAFNVSKLVKLRDLHLLGSESAILEPQLLMSNMENVEEYGTMTSWDNNEKKCSPFFDLTLLINVAGREDLQKVSLGGVLMEPSSLQGLYHLRLQSLPYLVSLNGIGFLRSLGRLELCHLPDLSCLRGIECLTNLRDLRVEHCASVEELPSLSELVEMQYLYIRECAKLRHVEGCNTMMYLSAVTLTGCKSLACIPALDNISLRLLRMLDTRGSKCASIEQMLHWFNVEECKLRFLCVASILRALEWELCSALCGKPREQRELGERLVKTLGVEFVKRLNPNDDYCSDFDTMASELLEEGMKLNRPPDAAVGLLRKLASVPKRILIEKCQLDAGSIESELRKCVEDIHPRLLTDVLQKYIYKCCRG